MSCWERFVVYRYFLTFRILCGNPNDSNFAPKPKTWFYASKWWRGLQQHNETSALQITRWMIIFFSNPGNHLTRSHGGLRPWCPIWMTGGIQVELLCLIITRLLIGVLLGKVVVYRHFMTFRILCRNHNDCNFAPEPRMCLLFRKVVVWASSAPIAIWSADC